MSGGYIILQRSIFGHYCFKPERFTEREAWIWLLMQASYQPHKVRYKNQIITVGRGEVPTSFRKLSGIFQWSHHTVASLLDRLEQEGMITRKTAQGFLVITICNYDKYQITLINTDTDAATHNATLTAHGLPQTERKVSKGKERKAFGLLPPEIPFQDWVDYEEMRKRQRKPINTQRTFDLAIAELLSLKAKGYDPGEVLQNSIKNSYVGLFPPKERAANNNIQPQKTQVATL